MTADGRVPIDDSKFARISEDVEVYYWNPKAPTATGRCGRELRGTLTDGRRFHLHLGDRAVLAMAPTAAHAEWLSLGVPSPREGTATSSGPAPQPDGGHFGCWRRETLLAITQQMLRDHQITVAGGWPATATRGEILLAWPT